MILNVLEKNDIDYIRVFGLSLFIYIFFTENTIVQKYISLTALINGLLCHLTMNKYCICWDILVNIVLIIFININTKWQPYTFLLSLVALIGFIISRSKKNYALIHVFFVQWVLGFCLIKYYD